MRPGLRQILLNPAFSIPRGGVEEKHPLPFIAAIFEKAPAGYLGGEFQPSVLPGLLIDILVGPFLWRYRHSMFCSTK